MLLITNVFLSMITKTRLDGLSKHGSAHASIYSKITELRVESPHPSAKTTYILSTA